MRSGPSISRICNELAMQMNPIREEPAPDISPTTLPIGQQLALLAMRRSKLSLACHDEIKRRDGALRYDFPGLRAALLAIRNPESGYHDLTPRGRWKANQLAQALAQSLPVHYVTMGGDRWNDYTVRCSCGTFSASVSRKERDPYSVMARYAAEHLIAVGVGSEVAGAQLRAAVHAPPTRWGAG